MIKIELTLDENTPTGVSRIKSLFGLGVPMRITPTTKTITKKKKSQKTPVEKKTRRRRKITLEPQQKEESSDEGPL